MENLFEVHANARTDEGKGASRRLRHAGMIPAIVYGAGKKPQSIALNHNQFLRHLEVEAFYAHVLTLVVDGKNQKVLLKDLQRHPANDNKILHADFLRVHAKHAVQMTVPLHFVNEDSAPGVKAGGVISHLMTEVEITCLPANLPEYIEVDLAVLELDGSIHLSEIELPKGVSLVALSHGQKEQLEEGERSAYDQAIVSIHTPRGALVDEEESEAESEGEEEEASEE